MLFVPPMKKMVPMHEIPLPLVKNLICRHCAKFVSCGPVHVVPDGSILCGRCRALAKPKFRNFAFEAIARTFMYPCCYWSKHCPRLLNWSECLDHERDCVYNSTCRLFCTHPGVICKSERKIPNTTDIPLAHVVEEVLDLLKCVACESYLSCEPVYIGFDGKNICHRCTISNGIPKGVIRNLSYERIASAIIFPCIYRFRGCTIRLKYGRDMWQHEAECSYGQIYKKPSKKNKNGKERGVIPTHSGHIWGTITPNSALFAPPSDKNNPRDLEVNQELTIAIKKMQHPSDGNELMKTPDSNRHLAFDTQSFESIFDQSRASTIGSQDDIFNDPSRYPDNLFRTPTKRSVDSNLTNGHIQDSGSRKFSNQESLDSISSYRYQRPSSRPDDQPRFSSQVSMGSIPITPPPPPTPGSQNGFYQENIDRWIQPQHLDHYPPIYLEEINGRSGGLRQATSFDYSKEFRQLHPPQRTESWKVGNRDIIAELKKRHNGRKPDADVEPHKNDNIYGNCNNLQDIVQTHEKVFSD